MPTATVSSRTQDCLHRLNLRVDVNRPRGAGLVLTRVKGKNVYLVATSAYEQ
jgi:hypothetical protein